MASFNDHWPYFTGDSYCKFKTINKDRNAYGGF